MICNNIFCNDFSICKNSTMTGSIKECKPRKLWNRFVKKVRDTNHPAIHAFFKTELNRIKKELHGNN